MPLFIISAIVYAMVYYLRNGYVKLDIEFFVGILSTMAVAYFSVNHLNKRRSNAGYKNNKQKSRKKK